jgi:hypothetical protein
MPQLEHVCLRSGPRFELGRLDLPNAKTFTLETCGLTRENFYSVADAIWPKLEKLEVWFGSARSGGTCTIHDLEALLERTDLPALKSLALKNAVFTDELVHRMARSPLLHQLHELDLSLGCLTDAGARALLKHRSKFAHLRRLNLAENTLEEMEGRVGACAQTVVVSNQRPNPGEVAVAD